MNVDRPLLLADLERLLTAHGPSGVEGEVDALLREMLASCGEIRQDAAGSLVLHFEGRRRDGAVAVTAHKDEICMIVKRVEAEGRLRVQNVGGLHPWAVGETPVEVLAGESVPGVLSIGSKHVSDESPAGALKTGAALTWEKMHVETKLDAQSLARLGVRPGRRVVLARARKTPWWLGEDYVCGYNLDCRGGLAVLAAAARQLRREPPDRDVYLVASAEEEVGGLGAVWSVGQLPAETVIALDLAPVAEEYQIVNSADPVLPCKDVSGLYHEPLVDRLAALAGDLGFGAQTAVLSSYASDATLARAAGSAGRAALIAYPGDNTHGYEICHAGGIVNCARLLLAFLYDPEG